MKKYFILIALFFAFTLSTFANPVSKFEKGYKLGSNSIKGIYIKDINSNEVLFEKNANKPLNPASTLKALIVGASYLVLGNDYQFETALYKDNNDIYIKLGADVLLNDSDLNKIFAQYKNKYPDININNIYIDSSIIEKAGYPDVWLEEDKWPHQREITPFVINGNYFEIALKRSSLATNIDIIQNDDYKLPIINQLELGEKNNYTIERPYGNNSSIIAIKGTISQDEIVKLPVLKPEINFNIKLKKALAKNKIVYTKNIVEKKVTKSAIKIASVSHSINEISKRTLAISDNLAPELIFRVAAAKNLNYAHSATFEDGINMLSEIFSDEINHNIKIVDASGISHNNFVTCEFLCKCLLKLYEKSDFENLMPNSNEGTLANRLLFLKDNLKAKTGTLSCVSSLLGTLKTKQNNDVVFCIITQNSSKRKAVIKNFENRLVGLIYRKY